MPAKRPTNPFYVALLPVGILFAITACAFVVMTMRGSDPQQAAESAGIVLLMQCHGVTILVAEIAVLAVLTFAAIGTDDYWTRQHEAREQKTTD